MILKGAAMRYREILLLLLLLSAFLSVSCVEQGKTINDPDKELIWVERDYKKGFIDQNGNIIIDFKYSDIILFSEGLASARFISGRWGYIDKIGNTVIEPKYAGAGLFSEGLASVLLEKGGKRGYIDKTGNVVIDFKYIDAFMFSEGLAVVSFDGDYTHRKYGFIDKTGNIVIEPQWEYAQVFKEGYCIVGDRVEEIPGLVHYGYINIKGELVIPIGLAVASDFKDGLALVWGKGYDQQFINTKLEPVLLEELKGKIVNQFSDGYALFQDNDSNRWGYIDKQGKVVIEPKYYEAKDFSEGLAAVQEENDSLWGFIDKEGKYFIKPQYTKCGSFFNGATSVEIPEQREDIISYKINKDKKIIWENRVPKTN